ncbi:MAG: TetR/AcrR family transcriptional regulator [Micropepsaceae bacterium]
MTLSAPLPQTPSFTPKKWPKQTRSKMSFDAMVDACARILRKDGYEGLTTNHIAKVAGVGIGTLYDFFPDKETIVAVLAEQAMAQSLRRMQKAFADAMGLGPWPGVVRLTEQAVANIVEERKLTFVLVRQIPFVMTLPTVEKWRNAMVDLAQDIRIASGDAINLPMPKEDTWLIAQMLFNATLEIGFLEVSEEERHRLTLSLARLTYRMAVGRDPEEDGGSA